MLGATVASTPTTAAISSGADVFTAQTQSPSSANSLRISCVADRLWKILDSTSSTAQNSNSMDLFQLCLSLARGIDYAVANNDVPSKAQELPILFKKVCQRKNDYVVQAAIMVLMISVKVACKFQWFTDNDTTELLTIANEIGSSFCSQGNINVEPNLALPTVLDVMERFCPQMKTGQIFASLQINPGYEAYLADFHIPKNHTGSPKDKIRLFVAQTDSAETSSCLISPPQVNFLLNGKGVEKRTTVLMDTRPQIPTDVTSMLKYGTNLLQVVGQFNGHYLIVIASINFAQLPEISDLPDYVPLSVSQDADAEIIEGRSRISLNCPISCKRIETPAKGKSCKHLKSFDLNNFLNLNIRTLAWRCPHCGQSTCYQDIRIDQYMSKILREVGHNVADVIIYEDGSWKPGAESNNHVNTNDNKTVSFQNDVSDRQENTTTADAVPMIHDLTEGDDDSDVMILFDSEDRKPFQANAQSQSNDAILPINPDSAAPIDDDFWTGIYLSTCNSMSSGAMSHAQTVGQISEMLAEELRGNTSLMQNHFTPLNNLQLHPSQVVDSVMTNEYGSFPTIQANVSRIPIAVQALPAQPTPPVPLLRPRNGLSSLPPNNGSSISPSSYGFNTISSGTAEGHQQFSRTNMGHLQVAEMGSSLFQHRAAASQMNLVQRVNQSVQQAVNLSTPTQLPTSYRQSTTVRTEQQNTHQQQAMNQRITQNISHPPNSMIRTPPHLQRTQLPQTGSQPYMGNMNTPVSSNPYHSTAHRAGQMARQAHHTSVQIRPVLPGTTLTANSNGFRSSAVGVPVQPVTATEDLMDISSEQNWRPTGRMRGSLSGQAYSTALSQLMTQPTHQTQVTRPLANPTSLPPAHPPHLQVLLANSRNAHASQTHNRQMDEPDSIGGNLDVLPNLAL